MNVFLSYDNRDRETFIDRLSPALQAIQVYPLIIDLQLVLGEGIGSSRDTRLQQMLRNCEYVIVVLSKHYMQAKWLQKELLAFLMLEKLRGTDMILPVLLDDCEIPPLLEGRICADFRGSFEEGFDQLEAFLSKSRSVFIIMKFGDKELDSAYNTVIKPVFQEFKYKPLRIDEVKRSRKITDGVLDEIRRSGLVFADLSGSRPNCYYEAGYAHALEKEIIFTIRKQDAPPHFDLKDYKFIIWETPHELGEALKEVLQDIRREALETRRNKTRSKKSQAPGPAARKRPGPQASPS